MFAQMKSKFNSEKRLWSEKTATWKNPGGIPYPLIFPILIPLVFPILFMGVLIYFLEPPESKIRHIEVNGKDCTIEYVIDRRNSHGGIVGHDKAVCP